MSCVDFEPICLYLPAPSHYLDQAWCDTLYQWLLVWVWKALIFAHVLRSYGSFLTENVPLFPPSRVGYTHGLQTCRLHLLYLHLQKSASSGWMSTIQKTLGWQAHLFLEYMLNQISTSCHVIKWNNWFQKSHYSQGYNLYMLLKIVMYFCYLSSNYVKYQQTCCRTNFWIPHTRISCKLWQDFMWFSLLV